MEEKSSNKIGGIFEEVKRTMKLIKIYFINV